MSPKINRKSADFNSQKLKTSGLRLERAEWGVIEGGTHLPLVLVTVTTGNERDSRSEHKFRVDLGKRLAIDHFKDPTLEKLACASASEICDIIAPHWSSSLSGP